MALKYPGLHGAAGSGRAGGNAGRRRARARLQLVELDPVQAAFNIGAHGALAGFQRHLAGGRVGPSFRQSRRHPRRGRLRSRGGKPAGAAPLTRARRAHRDDQGARDPGRAGAGEQLQSRRASITCCWCAWPRPRWPRRCWAAPRAGHQRRVQRLDRRRRAAHLPPRAQHRLAQELGGGRCDRARRAPGADRAARARWAIRRR